MKVTELQPLIEALGVGDAVVIPEDRQAMAHRIARKIGIKILTRQDIVTKKYTVKRITRH